MPAVISDAHEESEPANQALLLDNISKFEGKRVLVFFLCPNCGLGSFKG